MLKMWLRCCYISFHLFIAIHDVNVEEYFTGVPVIDFISHMRKLFFVFWLFPIITSIGASLSGSCSVRHTRNCGICRRFSNSYFLDIVFHILNITVYFSG